MEHFAAHRGDRAILDRSDSRRTLETRDEGYLSEIIALMQDAGMGLGLGLQDFPLVFKLVTDLVIHLENAHLDGALVDKVEVIAFFTLSADIIAGHIDSNLEIADDE